MRKTYVFFYIWHMAILKVIKIKNCNRDPCQSKGKKPNDFIGALGVINQTVVLIFRLGNYAVLIKSFALF